ncbi:hypothetical protein GCM10027562_15790 [Arthrobacter pigmenti]
MFVVIAATHMGNGGRIEIRRKAFDICHGRPMKPDGGGQIFSCQAQAVRIVAWMPEIGMSVQVDQPEGSLPAQRYTGTHQEAAVAAEHQRSVTGFEQEAQPVGQPDAVVDDPILVPEARRPWPAVVDIAAGQDDSGIERAISKKPGVQASFTQRFRSLRTSGKAARLRWFQSKIGRRGEDSQHASSLAAGRAIRIHLAS